MAGMYALPRDGGPQSERFKAYVTRAPNEPGLVAYNPMAGAAALETVAALIALDAESLALDTATRVVDECAYPDDFSIVVAVRSAGMWTHRIATDVEERAGSKPRTSASALVSLWAREPCSAHDVVRETVAECVRVMWTTMHGATGSVRTLLAREGLAYAIASRYAPLGPYDAPVTDDESIAVIGALDILGDSSATSDMAGVLFGDGACDTLGWTPLGIPDGAGYRWAIARAQSHVEALGAERAIRGSIIP